MHWETLVECDGSGRLFTYSELAETIEEYLCEECAGAGEEE